MITCNLHTHTNYCDGANTPREMVEAAIEKGFRAIGFSGHGYTPFDLSCCMSEEGMRLYRAEIAALKAEYAGRIDVFLGLENDAGYLHPRADYDYTIGSVHQVEKNGRFYCIDSIVPAFLEAVREVGGGDALALVRAYYDAVVELAESNVADILGHFDIVTKLNNDNALFDMQGKAYRAMAETAMERVVKSGIIVEINTGGMAKGYRDVPYPDPFLWGMMRELGAKVILSADAHSCDMIDYRLDEMALALRDAGFQSRMELTKSGFVEVEM